MKTEQKETPEQQLFERGIMPEDFISYSTYGAVVKIQKQNADLLSRVEELEKENERLAKRAEGLQKDYDLDGDKINALTEQVEDCNKRMSNQIAINSDLATREKELVEALTEVDDFIGGEILYREGSKTYNLAVKIKSLLSKYETKEKH